MPSYDWIWLIVVLLTFLGDSGYGFSTMGVGAIPGNGREIQGKNYVALLQGSERDVTDSLTMSGLTFSKSVLPFSDEGSFLKRGEHKLAFQF